MLQPYRRGCETLQSPASFPSGQPRASDAAGLDTIRIASRRAWRTTNPAAVDAVWRRGAHRSRPDVSARAREDCGSDRGESSSRTAQSTGTPRRLVDPSSPRAKERPPAPRDPIMREARNRPASIRATQSPRANRPTRPVTPPTRRTPRFTPTVQSAIDRVVERIAAEDAANAASRRGKPRPPQSASKRVIKYAEPLPKTANETARLPGAPQGYPSSSRLTDARWQVQGSPGTRRRQ